EISLNPIKNNDGEITHFVGIQNDITKRIITEQKNRQLIRIFNESDNEIYVFDAQTLRYQNVNFGARKNTGYSLKNFMKMTPLDIEPAFTERQFRKLLAPILKSAGQKIEYESSHLRKNGTTYPVEVHLQSSKVGEQCLISAVVFDITDKKEYTQKLERTVSERTKQLKNALLKEKELSELKSKFLSLVSHEFKTPLSSILTSATLVGKYKSADTQEKREKHLSTIVSGVHHLTGILNDFLSMERLEKGEDLYRFTNFSLSKVINEVFYKANLILKTGQQINYPMNIEDVSICQDEKIVELTLTNLINNAIKYSPERTDIDLLVALTPHTVTFKVVDRGFGIPEMDKKHIFERYFRAGNILTSQGTGIGLHIIKSHVQNLGGQVSFISKQNKGSTFTVTFPIEETSCEE
ncbi:MAG: PAS domain S-box protein, partial [Muriicola sp.]|nr:PAS domain S-box protein [Muriicola sp.]